jgi:hypothetical protein
VAEVMRGRRRWKTSALILTAIGGAVTGAALIIGAGAVSVRLREMQAAQEATGEGD